MQSFDDNDCQITLPECYSINRIIRFPRLFLIISPIERALRKQTERENAQGLRKSRTPSGYTGKYITRLISRFVTLLTKNFAPMGFILFVQSYVTLGSIFAAILVDLAIAKHPLCVTRLRANQFLYFYRYTVQQQ